MGSTDHSGTKPCGQHIFKDFCDASEHSQAFVASQLSNPVKGPELYKESYSKEKIKTINVALVVCLNMDIDPPDVQKIPPYSRIEAWVDPADAGYRVVDMIGKNLQSQYERWQPKGCYRQCLDPNLEEVKKICVNMRRNARADRILFHYNGHGVPRPTENGEIWVFNRTFTKYIPLSLHDLQRWLGGPSVYVIDCQNAGRVLKLYEYFCQRRQTEFGSRTLAMIRDHAYIPIDNTKMTNPPDPNGGMAAADGAQQEANAFSHGRVSALQAVKVKADAEVNLNVDSIAVAFFQAYSNHASGMGQMAAAAVAAAAIAPATMENTIMLCACEENEDLPQLAELPADLFTACLTTPIRTALRWHWMKYNKSFPGHIDEALLDHIPGSHGNRMSLLGEINWIFTAVTDTIAWCSFPVDLFQKLFRQDLLVASIFRNYLLAQRLMRSFGCHPCSWPRLNPTHDHPIWSAWDHSLDLLFHYLPQVISVMQTSPQADLVLLQQRQQKPQPNLPLLLPSSASAGGMVDIPRDLLELTSASAQRLTALLNEIDRQVEEGKQKKARLAEEEAKRGYGEQKRPMITPPPGYESNSGVTSKSRHHGRGSTSLSPRKVAKFVVETRELSRISEEERSAEISTAVTVTATTTVAPSAKSYSCPSHLPRSPSTRNSEEQGEEGHQHHHHGFDSEETEFSSSDIDVDEDDVTEDEEEEEEEEDDDYGEMEGTTQHLRSQETAEHGQRPQHQTPKQQQQQLKQLNLQQIHQPSPTKSPPEVSHQPPRLGLASTRSFRAHLHAAVGGSDGITRPNLSRPSISAASLLARCAQPRVAPVIGPNPLPLVHDSSPPDYRPASFFTSQMTAFQAWLHQASSNHTAYCQRQSAIQLPILLQVLLSQTHRIRALQLLSEFLDLGSWAVSHCITVGILPYIVRLFHSNVLEVKPHLVFIWGKIISSAQIDFNRHEGIRESGYRYFVACLQDDASLSPLVRTMAAFALAKMLVRGETGAPDVLFQEVYYSSKPVSFIHIAAEELTRVSAVADAEEMRDGHNFDHLKVWLLLALGRVWMHCDPARRLAVRAEGGRAVETAIFPRLCDADPVVRAAAVFALGTLIDQSVEEGKKSSQEADMLSHQVGIRLAERTRDPSPLVRCEVVVALRSLVLQCEPQMVEQAHLYYRNILRSLRTAPTESHLTVATTAAAAIINSDRPRTVGSPIGSPSSAAALLRGMAELGLSRFSRSSRCRSHKDLQRTSVSETASVVLPSDVSDYNSVPTFLEDFEPNVPGGIFAQLWDMILILAADPHPSVAKLATVIFFHIVREHDIDREVTVVGGRLFLRDPPTPGAADGSSTLAEVQVKTPAPSPQQPPPTVMTAQQIPRRRQYTGSDNAESTDKAGVMDVRTEFFQWCSQWFSQPLLHKYPNALQIQQPLGKTLPHSMDPPVLAPTLSPQNLTDLSSISTNPKAQDFSDHLLNFKKHSAERCGGRQRWHTIATGQRLFTPSPSISERDEIRRCMRHLVHRASRAASPLSPTRRNCRHVNRLTEDAVRFCSTTVSPHLRRCLTDAEATEAAEKEEGVNVELQLLHIFQAGVGVASAGTAAVACFHPYKPHLLAAEAVADGEEYVVSVWGVHRLEGVRRLTLTEGDATAEQLTVSDALMEAIKRQRALMEAYDLAQVTSLELLNTLEEKSLLLTASRDGCIRVWRDYDGKHGATPFLLTAWVALENQVPLIRSRRTAGVGLVTSWSDCSLHHLLHVSGDVRVVRTFDTDHEACVADFETHSDYPVTRLARAANDNDHIFAAGFADSAVKIFDTRLSSRKAVVFETVCGGGRVLDLAFAPYQADRRFYAVTSSGALGAWQLEVPAANATWQSVVPPAERKADGDAPHPPAVPICGIRAACLQVSLPCTRSHMVAYGGLRQFSVARLHDGRVIASYQPAQNLFPTAIAMHPYEPLIAVGMSDASIHLLKFRLPSTS
ncbi:Regulatory-associated protein of mTOR [Echinococcus granulosus]|uniref:Regulatory-associated protein of mTOR n=1 Tax=Echinococcus granulosus TaxID=6210 RepID=W6UVS0_ECHGR|nr:Regulatory-associated protein of mTOR [Echinococcus granulosus]EUB57529.1 Regulatory-associated protein of mTOR [Echinococcus granulosus]